MLALAGVARADDAPAAPAETKPVTFVFNIGAASDYEFRGISRTNNKAQIDGESTPPSSASATRACGFPTSTS